MASRRELQRLEDENRTLSQRLSDTEVELSRKADELKTTSVRKVELLNDLREHQRRLKETKCQLDKSEMAEHAAQASAREARQQLEQIEGAQRDQMASTKITISNLQLEIKSLKTKLAEKTEQHEAVQEKLHHMEELLSEMQGERNKTIREDSSRMANLNQALMKAKQNVAQLSEENTMLTGREQDLVKRCESLEQQLAEVKSKNSQHGATNRPQYPPTPKHGPRSSHHATTPIRSVPGETELESLQIENSKLKKELQCLQTNCHLMSQKSATVKKEKKEIEQSLSELQSEFDRVLSEKTDMEVKLEEAKAALCSKLGSMSTSQQKEADLEQQVDSLRSELSRVIAEKEEVQSKLKSEQERLTVSEDLVRRLQEKSKSLKEWRVQAESEFGTLNVHMKELEKEVAGYRKSEASYSSLQRQENEAIIAYKQKLEKVRGERRDLEEQLREASLTLGEMQSKNAHLEQANKTLKRQLAGTESAQQKLQQKNELGVSLSREVDELNGRLAAITEENTLLREECNRLEAEQKQSMEQIESLDKSRKEHSQRANVQEGVVKNLQEQIGRQESELNAAAESARDREAQCVSLTEQIEDLQLELANVQSVKHRFELEVGELVQKLEELEECNFELSSKLSDAHNETALVLATRDENETKLEGLRQKFQDVQALLLEKETQLSELKYSHTLLQSENINMVSQVSALSEMVAARNAKIESLQTEVMCFEANTRDIMSQIVTLEEEHGMCAQEKRRLQEQIDQTGSFVRDAERRERELEGEISSLRSELRRVREYSSTLESSNKELSQKVQAQAEREDELVSSCRQSEMKTHQLQQEVRERENAVASMKNELEFVAKSGSDVQASLQAEVESLNGKCRELRAKCDEHREVEVQMKSEILQLQGRISELQNVNEDLKKDRQPLQHRYDQTHSDLVKAQDELYQAQKDLKSTKSELRYHKRKRTEAEEQLGGMQGESDNTVAQFDLLREELLKVLEDGEENSPSVSRRKIKGILKCSKQHILKPLQIE